MSQTPILVIKGKFKVGKSLAAGAFGELKLGKNMVTGEPVAIKLERRKDNPQPTLHFEFGHYKVLTNNFEANVVGIPKFYYFGPAGDDIFDCLIMELLGDSLESLFTFCDRKFSIKTILQIALQMVERVEYLHSKRLIYRDIKPENFMFGRIEAKTQYILYILDFGLTKSYYDDDGRHIPLTEGKPFIGTARYASTNAMAGREMSRRDDLEAVGYLLLYFLTGSELPWQGVTAATPGEKLKKILDLKMTTTIGSLCKGFPEPFAEYLRYVRSLDFKEAPDYRFLKKLFYDYFRKQKYTNDDRYDWTERKQSEYASNSGTRSSSSSSHSSNSSSRRSSSRH